METPFDAMKKEGKIGCYTLWIYFLNVDEFGLLCDQVAPFTPIIVAHCNFDTLK